MQLKNHNLTIFDKENISYFNFVETQIKVDKFLINNLKKPFRIQKNKYKKYIEKLNEYYDKLKWDTLKYERAKEKIKHLIISS